MQLWLDDIRDPKDHGRSGAVWVKTAGEAIAILRQGKVSFISFDHDLGTELDGHDVATEIERLVHDGKIPMPGWAVHSANPVGEAEIAAAMRSALRFSSKNAPGCQIHVGLEIGTTKICVCVAEEMKDSSLMILGIGEAPSHGIRKGEIIDPDSAAESIRLAIREAEASSGKAIKRVSVAVTGSHLGSFTSTTRLILPKKPHEITADDIATVEAMVRKVTLPSDQILLQAIDGDQAHQHRCDQMSYEIGLTGIDEKSDVKETLLEADCHIIHGKKSRIQRTLDCLESLQLEVVNIIPSSVGCTSIALNRTDLLHGVMVIDLGGGATDYGVSFRGTFRFSGVLAVGGDHITSDISIGLRVPIATAEMLKVTSGSASADMDSPGCTISILGRGKYPDQEIDRISLDTLIHLRVREIFEKIRDKVASFGQTDQKKYLDFDENGTGASLIEWLNKVVLTGGGAKLEGITELAEEIFKVPATIGHARNVSGSNRIIKNPEFTTVIGVTKYAMESTPSSSGFVCCHKRPDKKTDPKKEFHTNEEYLLALQKERDRGKNTSRSGEEDLDVPTFMRKGTDGVEIKHAEKI